MRYYPFHPGDYIQATAHLEPMEDLAYRRLLDLYYITEKPIPLETELVARRIRMGSELVAKVLEEFFTKEADGWRKTRCDFEIGKYQGKADVARKNGKLGGRKPKGRSKPKRNPFGSDPVSESKPNQEPRTKNQEVPPTVPQGDANAAGDGSTLKLEGESGSSKPEVLGKKKKGGGSLQEKALWLYQIYPRKVGRDKAIPAIKRRLVEMNEAEQEELLAAVEGFRDAVAEWPAGDWGFIPHPATWFNQGRFADDPAEWRRGGAADPAARKNEEGAAAFVESFGG